MPQGWQLEFPSWSDLAGITMATGLHEPHEEFFVFSYLRPGDDVIDVGSNIGIYTVAFAVLGAKVTSFEPSSKARSALRTNVMLNDVGERVRIMGLALGDMAAQGAFSTDLDVQNHLVPGHAEEAASEIVDIMPLDALLEQDDEWFEGQRFALVKIDVEGHDEAVLCGARACLEAHRPVVLVETWEGGTAIRTLLAEIGYRVYRFDIDSGQLIEYPPAWSGQANFIAIPDDRLDTVRRRLEERPARPLGSPRVQWWIPSA
jgi:FkbM family methyltransferase